MEYGIDLKKYFLRLIRYWWVCIILAAVFGAALGGYKYIKDKNNITESETNTEMQEEISDVKQRIAETKANFDAEELQNVELAVEYYKQLQQYNRYLESSIYVSQDPYNVSKTTLYYVIELDSSQHKNFDEAQRLTDNIATAYISHINHGTFLDKMAEKTGVSASYLSELIQAKTDNSTNHVNFFRITFINDSDMDDISVYADEFINEYTSKVNDSFGKHSLKLVDTYTATVVDNSIMSAIQSMQADIYNASTRLVSIKKNFTTNQTLCYNDSILVVDAHNSQQDKDIDNETVNDISEGVNIDIQYILLGAILGIALYCGIILLLQIFSPYIVSQSGFQGMFGMRYLGVMSDDSLGLIAMKIKLACKSDEADKVALVGSQINALPSEVIDNLTKQLEKENIEAVKLENVLMDGNEMSELFNIGKCIFIERTGSSRIKNVEELVGFCKENKIKMYGVADVKA